MVASIWLHISFVAPINAKNALSTILTFELVRRLVPGDFEDDELNGSWRRRRSWRRFQNCRVNSSGCVASFRQMSFRYVVRSLSVGLWKMGCSYTVLVITTNWVGINQASLFLVKLVFVITTRAFVAFFYFYLTVSNYNYGSPFACILKARQSSILAAVLWQWRRGRVCHGGTWRVGALCQGRLWNEPWQEQAWRTGRPRADWWRDARWR